jgi:hypothetical protein
MRKPRSNASIGALIEKIAFLPKQNQISKKDRYGHSSHACDQFEKTNCGRARETILVFKSKLI